MSRSNGRLEPEVIVNFSDGFSYAKGKMEEAFRTGGLMDKAPPKSVKDPAVASLKREDIDLIVHEFEIPRAQAEKALVEHGGDVSKTLQALINPQT
ncbi:hypothetical protein BDZ94DRAFT_1182231 [Collybia nuda]|uniref:Nascent polypeptide-associated complex subunit alpha-like UBA domain-containing protein n=1 Tax=Collybia nuda TaxID=64659 RepID=A0A9P6CKB5_9AGAR|nr:hypothetical protein BDZ94DRAFT_1182231 [Collybia nuda]